MKLLQTQITPIVNSFLHIEFRDQPYLYSPHHGRPSYHAHPELELTLILEGHGKRIIGNKVTRYQAGDMVLVGAGVPHIWLSDPVFYQPDSLLRSKVIVTYINMKVFEQMFELLKELGDVKELVKQASKGINIYGNTRVLIADKLMQLSTKGGMDKINSFLQILHMISVSQEKRFIVDKDISAPPSAANSDRLIEVLKYIKEKINEPISLKEVAELACMTVPSFCRFFKNRTKMRFSEYLVAERMDYAQKLLIEVDKPISDIANLCGYNSNSHFCKVFKSHTGTSPYQFKININRASA